MISDEKSSNESVDMKQQDPDFCSMVAEVLALDVEDVRKDSQFSFIELGGDSVKAIQLSFQLQAMGLQFKVEDIVEMENSIDSISQQLHHLQKKNSKGGEDAKANNQKDTQAFSILRAMKVDIDAAQEESCSQIQCSRDQIEEILPMTAQQKGLWLGSLKQPGSYIAHWTYKISKEIDMDKLRKAWILVLKQTPMLRSRVVLLADGSPWQVVLRADDSDEHNDALSRSESNGNSSEVVAEYGSILVYFDLTLRDNDSIRLSVHHCLYDRWSMRSIIQDIRSAYAGVSSAARPSYLPFIQPLKASEREELRDGWRKLLASANLSRTSTAFGYTGAPLANKVLRSSVNIPQKLKFTTAALVTAAWALVSSKHRDPVDSVFGLTLWGRDVVEPPTLDMVFPTFSTLPFPATVGMENTVEEYLQHITEQLSQVRALQRLGLDDIASIDRIARNMCQFSSVLVVQPEINEAEDEGPLLSQDLQSFEVLPANALLVECTTNKQDLSIRILYDQHILSDEIANPLLSQLCNAIQVLASQPELLIGNIDLLGEADMKQLQQWIRPADDLVDTTLDSLVLAQASKSPKATAVWQTGFAISYEDLVEQARQVASLILERDVRISKSGSQQNVGVFFPKSYLPVVAMLGILLSGNTYVPLDPSHPQERIDKIIQDANISLVLCSRELSDRLESPGCQGLSIDSKSLKSVEPHRRCTSMDVTADHIAYMIYTSGSTGEPKGVVISHGAICTSVTALARSFDFDNSTRTFQFSSFAWDASCHDIWITLAKGGVICMPTEEERLEPSDFLREAQANYAMLTTTVASALPEDSVQCLSKVVFTGEPVTSAALHKWVSPGKKVWGAYGPTETTIVVLITTFPSPESNPRNLGYCSGAATWIVDQDDPNKLAPIGCIGELAMSGHTLAKRYHGDVEKTNSVFVEGLEWFKNIPDTIVERVYLTGDLVCYNPDGSTRYAGRKGGYTKINGNRVDLGEIEHALYSKGGAFDEVALQVCKLQNRDSLTCFIKSRNAVAKGSCQFIEHDKETRAEILRVVETMKYQLPPFMIPSLFVTVNFIPTVSSTGKINARLLGDMVDQTGYSELQKRFGLMTGEDSEDFEGGNLTNEEEMLAKAWSSCLELPASMLRSSSHFFRMGGDSVAAMKVSARIRESGASLRVNDVFDFPILGDMAGRIIRNNNAKKTDFKYEPFALIHLDYNDSQRQLLKIAASEVDVPESSIEDIYPCSPLQVQMLVASAQRPGSYIHRDIFEVADHLDDDHVRNAYKHLIKGNPILRTRPFIQDETGKFLQVVVKESNLPDINFTIPDEDTQQHESEAPLGLNSDMCRFSLRHGKEGRQLVWDMHHAIFDAMSHNLLLEQLHRHISQGESSSKSPSETLPLTGPAYQSFIGYLGATDRTKVNQFWKEYLDGAEYEVPRIFNRQERVSTNNKIVDQVQVEWKTSAYTAATYLRAAYALTLAVYTGSNDALFAETFNGRDAPLADIEVMVGPTFATIPARINVERGQTIEKLLSNVQKDAAGRSQHQQVSIDEICRLGPQCQAATRLDTHFLVQSATLTDAYTRLNDAGYVKLDNGITMALAIPISVVVTADKTGKLQIEAIFNDDFISSAQVELLLDHYKATINALLSCKESALVSELSPLGADNIRSIMSAQPQRSGPKFHTIPDLVFSNIEEKGSRQALYSSEVSYTYEQMRQMTLSLASRIQDTVKTSKELIATCLDKSPLAIIAQLAIMMSGHGYVSLDPSHPSARHGYILKQTNCPLMLLSPSYEKLFEDFDLHKLLVNTEQKHDSKEIQGCEIKYPKPNDVAYVIYTSGSTGDPKGVVIEHQSISITLQNYAERLKFTPDTRALLFAAFTFDASVMETWSVFVSGGCLCIPSDQERIGALDSFILKSKADCVGLTPTGAMLLDPSHHQDLKTLLLCGEKCSKSDIERWQGNKTILVNAYGPTETSVAATMNTDLGSSLSSGDIGTSLGGGVWIIDPEDPTRHLPVGSVGELYVSGDVLARGYLEDSSKTADKFLSPKWPEWTKIGSDRAYRTGDLAWLDIRGRLHYIGRQDSQMKVNGIRIEAGEIEEAIIAADLGVSRCVASTYRPDITTHRLVLFFVIAQKADGSAAKEDKMLTSILAMTRQHHEIICRMDKTLHQTISAAGIPDIYVPVSSIPLTSSGKVDRKHLTNLVESLHPSQLDVFRPDLSEPLHHADSDQSNHRSSHQEPSSSSDQQLSSTESILADLWASILPIPASTITASSHFVKSGGDSVSAIRLAALSRSRKLALPTGLIYANPVLRDMARACDQPEPTTQPIDEIKTPAPFEMLEGLAFTPVTASPTEKGKDYFGKL